MSKRRQSDSVSESYSVPIAGFHQGIEFISNGSGCSPALLALPPFLEALGGDADKAGSA
jgi:hypothetical protein